MAKDMRTWINQLEEASLLARIKKPVDPRTQMGALLWQARDRALLFENLAGIYRFLNTRTLVLPPGTPPDRVATLRTGIKRMAKDPRFVADWERIFGQPIAPLLVSPKEGEKIKNAVMKSARW